MYLHKEVIVVAPDQYKNLARQVSHDISKQPGFVGACWSIKQYEDNEFQMGGSKLVILIGNKDENNVTRDFLPVIKNLQNKAGACFGFDGTKAAVFGTGHLEDKDAFKDLVDILTPKIASGVSIGAAVAATSLAAYPLAYVLFPYFYIFRYFQGKKEEKRLRGEQTKAALALFLVDYFDAWVGIKN